MTPWTWFAGRLDEEVYDLAEESTREKAIKVAIQQLSAGEQFRIVEARASTQKKYEGADFIPFLRTRNAEIITVVAQDADALILAEIDRLDRLPASPGASE